MEDVWATILGSSVAKSEGDGAVLFLDRMLEEQEEPGPGT